MRKIDECIIYICNKKYHTNVYGIARSLIALSTIITLLCNDINKLIPTGNVSSNNSLAQISFTNISLFYLFRDQPSVLIEVVCILLLALVVIGIYPRITGIFHWWVSFSFFVSCPFVDGGDQVAIILSLLLIPVCLTDDRKWHWCDDKQESYKQKIIAFFSLTFIRIQVAIIYFHAATGKLNVHEWLDGTVLYYWFNHNTFGMPVWVRFMFQSILINPIGVVCMTWVVLLLEILLFMALTMNKNKLNWLFYIAIIFHLLIAIVHGLLSFFFSMCGALILYLCPWEKSFKKSSFFSYIAKI